MKRINLSTIMVFKWRDALMLGHLRDGSIQKPHIVGSDYSEDGIRMHTYNSYRHQQVLHPICDLKHINAL